MDRDTLAGPSRLLMIALITFAVIPAGCLGGDGEGNGDDVGTDGNGDGAAADDGPVEMYIVAVDMSLAPETVWQLHPATFEVQVGDRVNVTLKAANGNSFEHTLVIEGTDIRLGPLAEGESASAEFVATEAGTFAYYCDIGNHRELGQEGTLTVEG